MPILVTHLHVFTEFQINMSVCDADNERKWKLLECKGYNSAEKIFNQDQIRIKHACSRDKLMNQIPFKNLYAWQRK